MHGDELELLEREACKHLMVSQWLKTLLVVKRHLMVVEAPVFAQLWAMSHSIETHYNQVMFTYLHRCDQYHHHHQQQQQLPKEMMRRKNVVMRS